jgi:predicted MFS family arabinose efflux permease
VADPPEGLLRSTSRIALLAMLTYQAPFAALVAFGGLLARYADHASATDVELAFGAFFGVSLAVRALVTVWSPITRQTEALVASALATIAGVAVLGAASGLGALFIGMAILGAPHGVTFPLASSILAEHIPNERLGRANGRLMASTNALSVAVPFVCGWLIDAVGYRSTFLLLEVPVTGFAGLLVLALVRAPLTSIPVSQAGAF